MWGLANLSSFDIPPVGSFFRSISVSHKGQSYKLQPSKMKKMTEAQRGYIAGILDGEGHLYISGEFEGVCVGRIRVRITDECVVTALVRMTGIGSTTSHIPSQRRKDGEEKKRVYEWTLIKRMDVRALLESVMPYLVLKAMRARCLLELESLKDQGVASGHDVRRLIDKMSVEQTRYKGRRAGRDGMRKETSGTLGKMASS